MRAPSWCSGRHSSFGYSKTSREPYSALSTRTYALADMVYSPEVTDYVARAAGLPASKIGILGPRWVELEREQQFPSGPQRDRQILIEKDPYQITLDQETTQPGAGPGPGAGPPVIDVHTTAPSMEIAVAARQSGPRGAPRVRRTRAGDGGGSRARPLRS